jgi:hypothetical protein
VSENQVLHGDPRHQVEDFRREVLGRAALVVADMGEAMESLVKRMMEFVAAFKRDLLLVGSAGIQIEKTLWTKEGKIQVYWMVDRPTPPDPDLYHVVVDGFVDEALRVSDVPEELRREIGGFLRGMATQFAVLKKHAMIDLRRVSFGNFSSPDFRTLEFDVLLNGRPLRPRDIGW